MLVGFFFDVVKLLRSPFCHVKHFGVMLKPHGPYCHGKENANPGNIMMNKESIFYLQFFFKPIKNIDVKQNPKFFLFWELV